MNVRLAHPFSLIITDIQGKGSTRPSPWQRPSPLFVDFLNVLFYAHLVGHPFSLVTSRLLLDVQFLRVSSRPHPLIHLIDLFTGLLRVDSCYEKAPAHSMGHAHFCCSHVFPSHSGRPLTTFVSQFGRSMERVSSTTFGVHPYGKGLHRPRPLLSLRYSKSLIPDNRFFAMPTFIKDVYLPTFVTQFGGPLTPSSPPGLRPLTQGLHQATPTFIGHSTGEDHLKATPTFVGHSGLYGNGLLLVTHTASDKPSINAFRAMLVKKKVEKLTFCYFHVRGPPLPSLMDAKGKTQG